MRALRLRSFLFSSSSSSSSSCCSLINIFCPSSSSSSFTTLTTIISHSFLPFPPTTRVLFTDSRRFGSPVPRCVSSLPTLDWNDAVSCSEVEVDANAADGGDDGAVDQDTKPSIAVRAFFFSTSVDLKSLVEQNKANFVPPSSRMTNYVVLKFGDICVSKGPGTFLSGRNGCYMVVFQYGSIVLFNVPEHEVDAYLKIVKKHASGLLPEMRKDEYEVREKPALSTWMQGGLDYIMLQYLNIDGIRTIGSVLGQSIALDYYGRQVDGMVAEFTDINREMEATGKFKMQRKKLFQLVGKANSNLADVILKLGLFERSDSKLQLVMALSFNTSNSLYDFVVREGNGVKGVSDLGLPEVPDRYIQPPEERINKQESRTCDAPPIDLSKLNGLEHEKVVDEIVRAAETLGFFQVVNHGVPLELLESLKHTAHKFFSLPLEKKTLYRAGVSPAGPVTRLATSFVPEKEKTWEWKDYISMIYRSDEEALQYWPNLCRELVLEYLKLSSKMVRGIVEILIRNLGVTIDDSKTEQIMGDKVVNFNYYPPCPNPELTVGLGRHSDLGTITVLLQDEIGGLYVKMEEDNDAGKEEWLLIPPIPGALVINIGDILQILSNGKYKSAEHRTTTTSTRARVSVPLFILPIATERIGPFPEAVKNVGFARYREVLMQDYMSKYFGNAHEGKKKIIDFARINSA